jgi:hypothetical protein
MTLSPALVKTSYVVTAREREKVLRGYYIEVSPLVIYDLVPSPFVFQGEGREWGCSLDLQVYLLPLNDFELRVYSAQQSGIKVENSKCLNGNPIISIH